MAPAAAGIGDVACLLPDVAGLIGNVATRIGNVAALVGDVFALTFNVSGLPISANSLGSGSYDCFWDPPKWPLQVGFEFHRTLDERFEAGFFGVTEVFQRGKRGAQVLVK